MRKITIVLVLLLSNLGFSQIDLDFNTDPFPNDWIFDGDFEMSDAQIHPHCQEKALNCPIILEEHAYSLTLPAQNYQGGNLNIRMQYGIKDLYHALGVNSTFQKPRLFMEYAEGNASTWQRHQEIDLQNLIASQTCLTFETEISPDLLIGFSTVKIRFVYVSPLKTGTIYLLYWGIDKMKVVETPAVPTDCTANLGGDGSPFMEYVAISSSPFLHEEETTPLDFYRSFPEEVGKTATLVKGEEYDLRVLLNTTGFYKVWIDWNGNGIFEVSESIPLVESVHTAGSYTIHIPEEAVTGPVSLRIRTHQLSTEMYASNACSYFSEGEIRDYILRLKEEGCLTPAPSGERHQTLTEGSTLGDIEIVGENILWYSDQAKTTLLDAQTVLINGQVYFATQTLDGCESETFLPVMIHLYLGVEQLDKEKVHFYPNPFNTMIHVQTAEPFERLIIIDALGNKMKELEGKVTEFDLRDLATGVYFFNFQFSNGEQILRGIKR